MGVLNGDGDTEQSFTERQQGGLREVGQKGMLGNCCMLLHKEHSVELDCHMLVGERFWQRLGQTISGIASPYSSQPPSNHLIHVECYGHELMFSR